MERELCGAGWCGWRQKRGRRLIADPNSAKAEESTEGERYGDHQLMSSRFLTPEAE